MKRAFGISLRVLLGLLLVIIILIFTLPILFKDKIKTKIEQAISESVNAKVSFGDYKLGFFRDFPNLSFSLGNLSVTGIGKFENDTLAGVKSLNLVFNLPSLFKKTGYEVKSIIIDNAVIKTIVLQDGTANWDILKETDEVTVEEEASSGMKILLQRVSIRNSSISYIDHESSIETYLNKVNSDISGDMTLSETDLRIAITAGELTYIMDGMKYLNKAVADSKMDLLANLDSMKFTFRENYLTINDLKVNFTGWVAMPEDDIITDLTFKSEQTAFKTLLSLIPAVYTADYKDLKADGDFSLSGSARGVYSDADSTIPDISLKLRVNNGFVSYPSLPEQIKHINLKSDIFIDGSDMDKTIVNVEAFHMELAGNPFEMTLALKTPVSDPDIKSSLIGKIDLTALSKAVPIYSMGLSGIIDLSVEMAGRLSMIEKKQYESFRATGDMNIKDMLIKMSGYPEVKINEAGFVFTPAYAEMKIADLKVGEKSDFILTGKLVNYIPYILKGDVIKGNLSLRSKLVNLTEIMDKLLMDSDADDTTSLAVIKVPENIDFDFNALVDEFIYDKIKARNLKGHLIVKDGILRIREAGMNILGGLITMNADYDTRDTLKPVVKADLVMEKMGIKDAFNTFNTVQKLAPAAKGIDGKMGVKLTYSSLLQRDLMPLIQTINGGGRLQSEEVTLIESASYDKMKEMLKLSDNYTNTFKDLNVSFKINDGRIYVSPFNTRVGNIKMNISGDQGIDQTLNYIIKTELPRSDLGSSVNSLIDNMSAQAAAFGFSFKPSEIIKVNVKVTGTFGKPVVTPFFGSSPDEGRVSVKEETREAVQQLIDNSVDQAKAKARAEAEIQGDRLVQEAEERGRQIRDEAAKAVEKIRQEADFQAQKLLKEAENKGTVAKLAAQKGADSLKKEADKKADQLIKEADNQADRLVEEAKSKREELINKI